MRHFIFVVMCAFVQLLFSGQVYALTIGFEELDSGGWAVGWSTSALFSVDQTESYNGTNSLKYANSNPASYSYPGYSLDLVEGKKYRISGWIKTQNISGTPANGAMIGLEYYDKNNNYLGGTYLAGPKGTTSWTKYEETTLNPTPAGTVRGQLICYVQNGMTGTAWWDDVAVVPDASVFCGMTTDVFRNEARCGQIGVKAGIYLSSVVSGVLYVKDSLGQTLITVSEYVIDSDSINFSFDCGSLEPAEYSLACNVSVSDGRTEESILKFRKLTNLCEIDEHRRLLINGEPFFPLGTYWGEVTSTDLQTYASSDFNCLIPYPRLTVAQMDMVKSYDLKVIYSLKDIYYGTAWCPAEIQSQDDEEPYITSTCSDIKNHSALIAWYVHDERPVTMLDRLTQRQNFMRTFDQDHPTWAVTDKLHEVGPLLPSYDIVGTDPYPIPMSPASEALRYTQSTVKSTFSSRPVWMVPQIFNWAVYFPNDPTLRAPTYQEMRAMAWQCIAGGANGLLFYSFFDLKKDPGTFQQRWSEVCSIATEVKQFIPVLLSIEATPQCTFSGSGKVGWRIQYKNGETYLFVVNGDSAPHYVEFAFSGNISSLANQLTGGSAVNVNSNNFNVTLAALEAAVYKIIFSQ